MGNIKLCGWLGLLFVASLIVSFIGFSGNVSAVTIHDNTIILKDIPPTDNGGTVSGRNNTNPIFVLDQWYDVAYNQTNDFTLSGSGMSLSGSRNVIDEFNDIVLGDLEGQWVSTHFQSPSEHNETRFYYTTNLNATITHVGDGSFALANRSEWFLIRYFDDSLDGSNRRVHINRATTNSMDRISSANGVIFYENESYLIAASDNLNMVYPEGYEGDTVESLLADRENLYPHYSYLVTNKEIKAYNDLTQELPDLPEADEGWSNNEWRIMWYLFSCSEIDEDQLQDCTDREMVNSKMLDRDEEYKYEVDEYGDYLLLAEFRYESCYRYASYPDTPDYCILSTEHAEYSFVPGRTVPLYINGQNIVGNTADLNCDVDGRCYDDTRFKNCNVIVAIATLSFDDFNYADCLENISLLANMLSFDTIRFSNSWVSNGNCYTLGTLGNWLNLDNKLVCPYFSNEVRNTITPFITFILGLVMVRFIAGKGEHGQREVDI